MNLHEVLLGNQPAKLITLRQCTVLIIVMLRLVII